MSKPRALTLANEAATLAAGRRAARALGQRQIDQFVIYLRGDLGSGKTTFARGFLAGFGHSGRVPSPTYALIEPYEVGGLQAYHIDLFRLETPAEVAELGIVELAAPGVILLIEWPERGLGELPAPDLDVSLAVAGDARRATYTACSATADALLAAL